MSNETMRNVDPDFKAGPKKDNPTDIDGTGDEANLRSLAGVFSRFWEEMTRIPEGGKLNVSLKIAGDNGAMSIFATTASQVQILDRTDEKWKGSNIDGGTQEAWVIIRQTDANGNTTTTEARVSPFEYVLQTGEKAYVLKPDELKMDPRLDRNRGAMFRNKQELLS